METVVHEAKYECLLFGKLRFQVYLYMLHLFFVYIHMH